MRSHSLAGSGVEMHWRSQCQRYSVGATALFACILCATPLSLRFSSQGNVLLSEDAARAEIGRPLTATSVAGVHRRAERRAYRSGYYGYGAYSYRYAYGAQPYSYSGYAQTQSTSWAPNYGYAYATGYGYGAYSPAALACGKQLQKQCGGVPVLANNMQECLKKSEGKLSPSCVGLARYVVGSCERDALQHCQAVAAGQSNILGCLRTSKYVVSPQCHAALDTAFVR
jgi:hypothetical protein